MVRRSVYLDLHQDYADDGTEIWWADSPEVPGLTVSADTKKTCLDRAHAAIIELIAKEPDVLSLVWAEHRAGGA